jgi:hypothetical protein
MADDDLETSDARTTPLRLAEILAAIEMMPELGGLPPEEWPSYQSSRFAQAEMRAEIFPYSRRALMCSRIWLRRLSQSIVQYLSHY